MHNFRFPLLVTLLLFGALAFTACGDDDDDGGAAPTAAATEAPARIIDVTLSDFAIALSDDAQAAGDVRFVVANEGATPHEFVIVKTNLAADALPMEGGAVDEAQVEIVHEIEEFPAGETEEATLTLATGGYVLICNIPGHYQLGMTVAFTVE